MSTWEGRLQEHLTDQRDRDKCKEIKGAEPPFSWSGWRPDSKILYDSNTVAEGQSMHEKSHAYEAECPPIPTTE